MTPNQEQREQLIRVGDAIADYVMEFCRDVYSDVFTGTPPRFFMEELTSHVRSRQLVAPDSAGRILRALRKLGKVDYFIVNRRSSLYELRFVSPS